MWEIGMPRPPKDFKAFSDLTERLLTVPKSVVDRRIEKHREEAAQNPSRRGPKPKPNASGVGHEDA